MSKFIIRERASTDDAFIYTSFLKGLRYGSSEWLSKMPEGMFYNQFNKYLKNLIERPQITIKIACLPDDPDVILGYIVYESGCIHWIFVKDSFRRMGIGKMLFPNNITRCSHLSKIGNSLAKKYNIVFNPFIGD
jgi:GNAT superfamily N-acetyltransferase